MLSSLPESIAVVRSRKKSDVINLKARLSKQRAERAGREMITMARRIEREPLTAEKASLVTGGIGHLNYERAAWLKNSPRFKQVCSRLVHMLKG